VKISELSQNPAKPDAAKVLAEMDAAAKAQPGSVPQAVQKKANEILNAPKTSSIENDRSLIASADGTSLQGIEPKIFVRLETQGIDAAHASNAAFTAQNNPLNVVQKFAGDTWNNASHHLQPALQVWNNAMPMRLAASLSIAAWQYAKHIEEKGNFSKEAVVGFAKDAPAGASFSPVLHMAADGRYVLGKMNADAKTVSGVYISQEQFAQQFQDLRERGLKTVAADFRKDVIVRNALEAAGKMAMPIALLNPMVGAAIGAANLAVTKKADWTARAAAADQKLNVQTAASYAAKDLLHAPGHYVGIAMDVSNTALKKGQEVTDATRQALHSTIEGNQSLRWLNIDVGSAVKDGFANTAATCNEISRKGVKGFMASLFQQGQQKQASLAMG
jgi:hypothetical protein